MILPVYIKVSDENHDICDQNCPFLDHYKCKLFDEKVHDTEPPDDLYQDKDRCAACLSMGD